ncbi:MAG TPA: ribosomal protein S18-alanine N-acetyltransferase [Steroidobacteraceae bacterium]|jgi:ribosomal-protein-alanine N-acetyltransferase
MAAVRQDAVGLPEVTIRSMHEADVAEVVRIERASYAFPWTEGIFRDCLRVNYFCRVVEIGGVVIGHGVMSVGASEAHLLNVCVEEVYRCRGIGGGLLRHLMRAAVAAGASEAFLEARPSNLSAIRLYQSLGFTQIGIRRGYYQAIGGREDAIVLKRHVD